MAKWQFRRSKKLGPFRLNVSKGGFSVSGGVKGARIGVNSKGQAHRTIGVPGTGLYKRERIGEVHRSPIEKSETFEMTLLDGTGGSRALLDGDADVEALEVVDLRRIGDVGDVAVAAGLTVEKPQGIRLALLVPSPKETAVALVVYPDDNPKLFSRKQLKDGNPRAIEIGRLSAKAAKRLAELAPDREVLAGLYIDARPMREHVEARVRLSALADDDDGADGGAAP